MKFKADKNKLPIIFLAILGVFLFVTSIGRHGDFEVYLGAAKLLAQGSSPYKVWIPLSNGHTLEYLYSPFWGMLLVPLSKFHYLIPNGIWLLLNLFFLYRIIKVMTYYLPHDNFTAKNKTWLIIITLLLIGRFLHLNFIHIQMTIYVIWSILESILLIKNNRNVPGALILGAAINIKVLPLVLLAYLIYRGYFKAFALTLISITIFLVLPSIYFGWQFNLQLHSEWWNVINPINAEHMVENAKGAHSLSGMIPTLLTEVQGEVSIRRNIFTLSKENAILIMNICRAMVVALTLYFVKWPPFKTISNNASQLRELSYLCLVIPLLFPRQQNYAFFMMLPSLYYLSHFIITRTHATNEYSIRFYAITTLMICCFVFATLTSDGIIGKELKNISRHYRLITWGALTLIPALMLADYTKVKKQK